LKRLLFTLSFFVLFFTLGAQDGSIDEKIKKMMDVMGTTQQFEVAIDNMVDLQKDTYKDALGDEFWAEFKKEVRKDGFQDLMDLLVPIYKKHLTEEEIDAITEFYSSEIGRKMIQKFPMISQESMQAGAEWGRKMGIEIDEKLEKQKN
jgi:hypothetical protein